MESKATDAKPIKLFGVWWEDGSIGTAHDRSIWQLMTFTSGGLHIPGTGFKVGRIHYARVVNGIYRTTCGRRVRPGAAFVRAWIPLTEAQAANVCNHCFTRGL